MLLLLGLLTIVTNTGCAFLHGGDGIGGHAGSPVASVQSEGVRWAGKDVSLGSFRPNTLHAPDTRYTAVNPGAPVTVSSFGPIMRHAGIRNLLGISEADFARADVIAFEGNGGYGPGADKGWEGSIWTFTDGANTYEATFNESLGAARSDPSIVKTGSIIGPDGDIRTGYVVYSNFFGLCCPDPDLLKAARVISYILFDLDSITPIDTTRPDFAITTIDTTSPNFAVTIKSDIRRGTLEHNDETPDPDAIGILKRCSPGACPVPVSE